MIIVIFVSFVSVVTLILIFCYSIKEITACTYVTESQLHSYSITSGLIKSITVMLLIEDI